jgi:anti-sigma factor RsiW
MSLSMTRTLDDPILIHAYLDGELDPINALEMEKRITADPALAAECDRIQAIRQLLRERLPLEAPSKELRTRIETAVGMQAAQRPSWRALAASIAVTAIIASGSTWMVLDRHQPDMHANSVVTAHVRGLMAPQATDVTSSETHTVKPWFSGRIPQAPRVVDLAKAGFPLAGGRIDVIGRSPSPTLVYNRRKHIISVTAVAAAGSSDIMPSGANADGYNVIRWVDSGVAYWAVSDLNVQELGEFVKLFRAA